MNEKIGALILAAGSSSRMGRPKQALKYGDTSLLRHAATTALAAGCSPVIVVTGANADASRRELEGLSVQEAWNPQWSTGMGSSISVGITALVDADAGVSAVVVMLCDQPFVTADVLARLISAKRTAEDQPSVVASGYGRDFGVPALFSRSLFAELAKLKGTAGAKAVIARHTSKAQFISFPEGAVDVDTPEDYVRLISRDLKQESAGSKR